MSLSEEMLCWMSVYALSRSYLDFLGYFRFFSIFMPKLCSGGFKSQSGGIVSG